MNYNDKIEIDTQPDHHQILSAVSGWVNTKVYLRMDDMEK